MNLQNCVPSWLFAVIFFFISIISCKYMMFVHKKVNNVQEELLSYFFASERVFLYCFSLFPLQATCLRFELLMEISKNFSTRLQGQKKEEKNQQTWLAWYIKRQNNRGIHWFFYQATEFMTNSHNSPVHNLCPWTLVCLHISHGWPPQITRLSLICWLFQFFFLSPCTRRGDVRPKGNSKTAIVSLNSD